MRNSPIERLDRVFSEYIRSPDSAPFGGRYFRCISYGQIKPYYEGDCGHFIPRTNMATKFNQLTIYYESICPDTQADRPQSWLYVSECICVRNETKHQAPRGFDESAKLLRRDSRIYGNQLQRRVNPSAAPLYRCFERILGKEKDSNGLLRSHPKHGGRRDFFEYGKKQKKQMNRAPRQGRQGLHDTHINFETI